MIPKIIHYCWFGDSDISPLSTRCIESWNKHLSDYKIVLWNESNMPKGVPFLDEMIAKKKWAFASDYMRHYAIYRQGGIYFDTDVEVIKSFDALLSEKCFLGLESKGRLNTSVLGAEQSAEYPKLCMDEIERRHKNGDSYLIAPELATLVYAHSKAPLTVYPEPHFYPYNPYDIEKSTKVLMFCDISSSTYAIHHWNHGWRYTAAERLSLYVRWAAMQLKNVYSWRGRSN